jgi:hypothetical protein
MPTVPPLRRRVSAAAILAAFAMGPMTVRAVPLYYSFSGQVIYSTVASHALGQSVRYTFLVDREGEGRTIAGDGTGRAQSDYREADDWFTDFFAAAYVGGDALRLDNPASPIKESSYYGMDQVHTGSDIFSALRGSNADMGGFDLLDIWSADTRFGDWQAGQTLLAENLVANGPGELNSSYSSMLTLTGITESNPLESVGNVPEPPAYALFAIGLVGLCAALKGGRLPRA